MPDDAHTYPNENRDIYLQNQRIHQSQMVELTKNVNKLTNSVNDLIVSHTKTNGVLERYFDRLERCEKDIDGLMEIKDKVSKHAIIKDIVMFAIFAFSTAFAAWLFISE